MIIMHEWMHKIFIDKGTDGEILIRIYAIDSKDLSWRQNQKSSETLNETTRYWRTNGRYSVLISTEESWHENLKRLKWLPLTLSKTSTNTHNTYLNKVRVIGSWRWNVNSQTHNHTGRKTFRTNSTPKWGSIFPNSNLWVNNLPHRCSAK